MEERPPEFVAFTHTMLPNKYGYLPLQTNKISMNAKVKFTTTLLLAKKTATGIKVPDELVEELNAGKRPPVVATINGYSYRNTIAVMDGAFMLSVSAEVREKAGINGGDTVTVELELDTQPREVAVPDDFQKELKKNAAAMRLFETLSNSNKKRYIIPIEQAKTEETRARRIGKAIADLTAGKK